MQEDNLYNVELNQNSNIKIYSKKAIWGFSIFFSPIFGGMLLRQNLIDSERKKEANLVLLGSIVFAILTIVVINNLEHTTSSLTYIFNLIGGAVLSEYFYKKYFPNDNYQYKKIWKALLISAAITIPIVLAKIYFPTE